jgi:hypothetical protein
MITGDADATPPDPVAAEIAGRVPDAVFARDAIFRYRTFVSVWLPGSGEATPADGNP